MLSSRTSGCVLSTRRYFAFSHQLLEGFVAMACRTSDSFDFRIGETQHLIQAKSEVLPTTHSFCLPTSLLQPSPIPLPATRKLNLKFYECVGGRGKKALTSDSIEVSIPNMREGLNQQLQQEEEDE